MSVVKLDTTGLRCPEPILKIAEKLLDMKPGDVLEVSGDCSTFEVDVRAWCKRMKKTLLFIKDEGAGRMNCQIQF
jgi:tRNA 2-thiouridine synthesizing protein A